MASLETSWITYHRGPRAKDFRATAQHPVGAVGLSEFLALCDIGKPGTYELRGNAARKTYALALAKVKSDEFDVTWNVPEIFFALGAKGAHDRVAPVVEFLRGEGAMV